MVSKHTAHSSPEDSLTDFRFDIAVPTTAKRRVVPDHFDDNDRVAFLAVAERCAVEEVNAYAVVALGAGAYVSSLQFPKTEETIDSWVCHSAPNVS
jgi:hypothetical protein